MATACPDSEVSSSGTVLNVTTDLKYDVQQIPHFCNTMLQLKSFRLKDSFCDVTIILQNQLFRAHKVILAAGSGYFRAMFTPGHGDSSSEKITLNETPDLDTERFALLLDFMYTGELQISLETFSDILAGATYLQINHAVQACADYINQAFEDNLLTFELIIKILSMTSGREANGIKEAANRYLAAQFSVICNTESFLKHITFQNMCDLLERSDLVVTGEEEVLEAVLSWMKYDWNLRKIYAIDLLRKVRLLLLPIEKLTSVFEDQLKEIPKCTNLFIDILKYHSLGKGTLESTAVLDELMLTPRGTFVKGLVAIGKKSCIFDEESKTLKYLSNVNLSNSKYAQSVAVAKGQIYVAGGGINEDAVAVLVTYSRSQEKWITCSPMNTARSHFGFLYCDGYLYAVGGRGSDGHGRCISEDSFARYHISGNKWEKLPRLPYILNINSPLCPPSLTVFSRCILVSGYLSQDRYGQEVHPPHKCHLVMFYNTTTNVWYTPVNRYLGDYHELHVYVKDGSIYLIAFQKVASKHGAFSPMWLTCPTVYQCECYIQSDPLPPKPCFTIRTNTPVSQTCIPETNMRVFRIDSEVYIILRGHVYKTKVTIGRGQVFDADMSSHNALSHIDSNEFAVTSFNVNKKDISTTVLK